MAAENTALREEVEEQRRARALAEQEAEAAQQLVRDVKEQTRLAVEDMQRRLAAITAERDQAIADKEAAAAAAPGQQQENPSEAGELPPRERELKRQVSSLRKKLQRHKAERARAGADADLEDLRAALEEAEGERDGLARELKRVSAAAAASQQQLTTELHFLENLLQVQESQRKAERKQQQRRGAEGLQAQGDMQQSPLPPTPQQATSPGERGEAPWADGAAAGGGPRSRSAGASPSRRAVAGQEPPPSPQVYERIEPAARRRYQRGGGGPPLVPGAVLRRTPSPGARRQTAPAVVAGPRQALPRQRSHATGGRWMQANLEATTMSAEGVEGWEPRHYRRPVQMPHRCLLFPVAVCPSTSAMTMKLVGPAWFRISNHDVRIHHPSLGPDVRPSVQMPL